MDRCSPVDVLLLSTLLSLISILLSMFGLNSNAASVKKYQDIIHTRGGPLAVKRRLAKCLEEIWKEILGSLFKVLMPCRVAAVIKTGRSYDMVYQVLVRCCVLFFQ